FVLFDGYVCYVFFSSFFFFFFFFFFSSRRRHTRSYGDWSSDVCSSDLAISLASVMVCPDKSWENTTVSPSASRGLFVMVSRSVRSEERRVGKEGRCGWWGEE